MAQLREELRTIADSSYPKVHLWELSKHVRDILFADPPGGSEVTGYVLYKDTRLLINNSLVTQKSRSIWSYYSGSKGSDDSGIGGDDVSECGSFDSKKTQKWKGPDSKGEYEVQKIVNHCIHLNRDYFCVKWCGWGDQFNTWEPLQHLRCHEALRSFMKNYMLGILTERKTIPLCKKLLREAFRDIIEHWVKTSPKSAYTKDLEKRIHQKPAPMSTLCNLLGEMYQTKSAQRIETLLNFVKDNCALMRLKELRREQQAKLKEWEDMINSLGPGGLTVENYVDLEGPPREFTFIKSNKSGDGIDACVMVGQVAGCECTDTCGRIDICCPNMAGVDFAYSRGRLIVSPRCGIFECNRYCKCDANCPNRVVQSGRKVKLVIFRTANGRGWGLKAGERIEKGTFLATYLGEIITGKEAALRDDNYEKTGLSYLFDLDMIDEGDAPVYTVDAMKFGNESHFINHSCNPNAHVAGVWIETNDPAIPLLALFAKKEIKRGEEITFNYQGDQDHGGEERAEQMKFAESSGSSDRSRQSKKYKKRCRCEARNCKGYYF